MRPRLAGRGSAATLKAMSGTETATLAEPAPHEIDLPSALHRERPPAGHLRVLDLCLAEGVNTAYLDAGARVVGLRHGGTPLHVENSAGYFRLAEYDPSRPPKEWGVRADDWDLVLVGSDSRLEELTRMSTLLAAGGVLAWIGPRPATAEVADHMRSAGLRVRFDGPCAAPRSAGIRAPRWLAVGVDPRPTPVLEGAVARVDRTACVDRSRLLELPRRPLWRAPSRRSGSTKGRDLVAALEAQVEAGEREIDLESLPWHPRGRAPRCAETLRPRHPSTRPASSALASATAGRSQR